MTTPPQDTAAPATRRTCAGPYLGPGIAVPFAILVWVILFGAILWRL